MRKITIFLPALMLITAFFSGTAAAQFSDVGPETTYSESIWWLSDNGVIEGYPDGTFKPENCVNRVEFLKMLYLTNETNIDDLSAGAGYADMFSDVDTDAWYWPYLRYALQTGTVEGYPDGTFKPARCTNRVEAIKMATLEFNNGQIPPDGYAGISLLMNSFKDIDQNAWYYEYFRYAVTANILGMEHVTTVDNPESEYYGIDQYYHPAESMPRNEVSEMLYRLKTIKDNPEIMKYSNDYVPDPI
jgi:hypothetical protein